MEIISFLNLVFVNPLVEIFSYPIFFAEVVISGLLTGVMYSLLALGFVLIFKSSGVFILKKGSTEEEKSTAAGLYDLVNKSIFLISLFIAFLILLDVSLNLGKPLLFLSAIFIRPSFDGSTFSVIEQPVSISEQSHFLSAFGSEIISFQLNRSGSFLFFESHIIGSGKVLFDKSRQ